VVDGLLARLEHEFTTANKQGCSSCFLRLPETTNRPDFVVDLDDVGEWMGFSKKDKTKNLLRRTS
jgi:hypothetical protein